MTVFQNIGSIEKKNAKLKMFFQLKYLFLPKHMMFIRVAEISGINLFHTFS